eukprot:scaffold21899_cov63-Phaeocystis_antarctica.AAC.4
MGLYYPLMGGPDDVDEHRAPYYRAVFEKSCSPSRAMDRGFCCECPGLKVNVFPASTANSPPGAWSQGQLAPTCRCRSAAATALRRSTAPRAAKYCMPLSSLTWYQR